MPGTTTCAGEWRLGSRTAHRSDERQVAVTIQKGTYSVQWNPLSGRPEGFQPGAPDWLSALRTLRNGQMPGHYELRTEERQIDWPLQFVHRVATALARSVVRVL